MSHSRSEDTGARTQDFTIDILVVCPKCSGCAHVQGGTRLSCPTCGLRHVRSKARLFGVGGICYEHAQALDDWYGWLSPVAMGNASCPKCGNRVEARLKKQPRQKIARLVDTIEGACATCGTANAVDIIWVPFAQPDEPRERGFGAQLFLVVETPKGTLFAFNHAHAQKLLDYISSDQRGPAAEGHEAMFAVLPGWVKAAKNRKLVEKVLATFTNNNCRQS